MVQEAMNRQMSAERDRRAKVTEAEGRKQSVVLVAEGERQSRVLRAEGERESIRLQAEGTANALTLVSESAATIDARTMALQQFEALKALGASPTTRVVLPVDLLPMAKHIGEYAELALAASQGQSVTATTVVSTGRSTTPSPVADTPPPAEAPNAGSSETGPESAT